VNRLYYAAFYAARALLATRDVDAARHSGLITVFQQHFVKTGLVPAETGKVLARAFEKRQTSDYGDLATIDPARHNAHKNLGLALAGLGRFVEAACCLLEADRRCLGDRRARQHLADLLATHPEVLVEDLDLATACRDSGMRIRAMGNA
jgi:HEPN domain